MDFKNILVAYDSSGFSNRAFKSALDVADPGKSKITIVSVVTGIYQPSIGYTMKYAEKTLDAHEKFIKKIYSNLQSLANKKGIDLSLKIIHNPSVSRGIITFANSRKFDLIVIGSHGRTGLNKLILGSVANDVAHKSSIPVMVVK